MPAKIKTRSAVSVAKLCLFILALYVLSVGLLGWLLPLSACFQEQWETFYWDRFWISDKLAHDGFFALCRLFVVQFGVSTWMLAVPLSVMAVLAGVLLAWVLRHLARPLISLTLGWLIVLLVILGVYGVFSAPSADTGFRTLFCLSGRQQWTAMTAYAGQHRPKNLLEQNLVNQAWAERGMLPEHVLDHPTKDVNSLFVLKIGSPYVAAHLSEIYWTMGEVAMSRMYAFEANEKMNNLSPRMLKRLALTNIVYGEYAVADKYLRWLEHTLFYRDWAAHYRTFLWNDEAVDADPLLGRKRRCIPAENGFPSAQSAVYDLEQMVRQNPGHVTSAQYLQALKIIYHVQ